MIIIMHPHVTDEEIHGVETKLKSLGLEANISRGVERTIIGAIGDERKIHKESLQALPGVDNVMRVVKPYKIVAREWHEADTVIDIQGIPIGGHTIQVIGGPCSVETQSQMDFAAQGVANAGCRLMRGGAFGKGLEGLKIFHQAADKYKLPIVTELMGLM